MYLNADMFIAKDYQVIDVNSGIPIPRVSEADDETGKFSMYLVDGNGDLIYNDNGLVILDVIGNIKIIKNEEE
jgi:hypothetical protein